MSSETTCAIYCIYFSCSIMLPNTVGLCRLVRFLFKQNIDLPNACFYAQHWTHFISRFCVTTRTNLRDCKLLILCSGVSKMVLTKCVEPPTRHSQEVVYDFEFIEDYVQPPAEPRLELESGGRATMPESFQFARLSTPSSGGTASGSSQGHRPRGRNLIKPSDYNGLEHPLMLMV